MPSSRNSKFVTPVRGSPQAMCSFIPSKVSGEPVTPDCVQALIGPLKPPPYHRYAAPGFEDFDEILREWLLNATDRVFPRLWQFLLLGNRVVPDWALLLYATVTLPVHAAKILVPTILFRRGTPA